MKVGLISCTKAKLPHRSKARDLYSASSNFRKRVAYVEKSCDRWFVLSAKHHLVDPDQDLDPYDETLMDASISEKRVWSEKVLSDLEHVLGDLGSHSYEIHAGHDYWGFGFRQSLEKSGAEVSVPTEGLGMFELSSFYAGEIQPPKPTKKTQQAEGVRGSYDVLRSHLEQAGGEQVALSFSQIEDLIGRKLPASARNHRAWWSNSSQGHSHARSWLDAGWKVDQVILTAERVSFRRS